MNDYPDRKDLKILKKWDVVRDPIGFIEYVRDIMPDNGKVTIRRYKAKDGDKAKVKIFIATGGWSGCEEIVNTIDKTLFSVFYWKKSERGGAFWYEI